MYSEHPRFTATAARRPIHPMLASIPMVCFGGTLLTDLVYWSTADMMWADFSAWLVTVGLILGLLAAIAGLADFARRRRAGAARPGWPHAVGEAAVLALALLDTLMHSRDAWTSVVPWGLVLSAATLLAALASGWMGRLPMHRRPVGPEAAE